MAPSSWSTSTAESTKGTPRPREKQRSFIPIPIPGVKLGLANIPVLVALAEADAWGACWVAAIKVLATGLLFGNPVTLAYSVVGTTLAVACMAPLSRLRTMRLEMVSVVGAIAHVAGQLLVAQWMLGTTLVWHSASVLMTASALTGLLCGIAASRTAGALRQVETNSMASAREGVRAQDQLAPTRMPAMRTCALFVAFIAIVIAAMHTRDLRMALTLALVSVTACVMSGIRPPQMAVALVPMLPVALLTVIAQMASSSVGPTIASFGPLAPTSSSLEACAVMLARLACVSLAGIALVSLAGRDELVLAARTALRPLRSLGLPLAGPELAFAVAAQVSGTLTDRIAHMQVSDVWSRGFWTQTLPQMASEL